MRVLALFCTYVLFAGQTQATPAAAESAVWPDQGPYRTVGKTNFRTIQMPVAVAESVHHIVPEDPSTWEIVPLEGSPDHGRRILEISGKETGLTLLVGGGHWVNLTAPAAVQFLNDAVRTRRSADLRDKEKLEKYLGELLMLHCGGIVLTTDFERQRFTESRISYWLGREKRPEALHALCHDPVVTGSQDHRVTIHGNVLLYDGSVERWTFHLRVGKAVRIETIDRMQLRKKGTFYFALDIAGWNAVPSGRKWYSQFGWVTAELV